MSQTRITLPITVQKLRIPSSSTEALSPEHYWHDPQNAEFQFVEPEFEGTYGPFDAWDLRREFLEWPTNVWQSFFVMAGAFGTERITEKAFVEWQQLLKKALLLPAHSWRTLAVEFDKKKVERLRGGLSIQFDWDKDFPSAEFDAKSPLDAMIASIQLDKLRGAEFRICARRDCAALPFETGTRQKIYCSSDCAHLVAVRNKRQRDAEIAPVRKPKTRPRPRT